MSSDSRFTLTASHKVALQGAQIVGIPAQDEVIEISIVLAPMQEIQVTEQFAHTDVDKRTYMSRDEHASIHGADPAAAAKVVEVAKGFNLTAIETSLARRTVRLRGTVNDMQAMFGVELQTARIGNATYRVREGTISIPAELKDVVQAVLGLDNRPAAVPHFRRHNRVAPPNSYTVTQVAQLYQFPPNASGKGQTIGILELGGGYNPADMTTFFQGLGVNRPTIVDVSVDGATNSPSTPDSADGEVCLDIQVAGGVATDAKIVVYFAPNQGNGFFDALTTAIHDATNKPTVISISWGMPEDFWTQQSIQSFEQALQSATTLGVTVCVASGDNGAYDIASNDPNFDGKAHVDYPAASQYCLGCGGTLLDGAGSTINAESVWNEFANGAGAGGGGVSGIFPVPAYQSSVTIPPSVNAGAGTGRGVPDVSGDADPNTGYQVVVDGTAMVIGGTSAVAPLWAGLIARLNEATGKPVGFLNPTLYSKLGPSGAFNDIVNGTNGDKPTTGYSAKPGWDAASGWGSPIGTKILSGFTITAAAVQPADSAVPAQGGS